MSLLLLNEIGLFFFRDLSFGGTTDQETEGYDSNG